MLRRLTAAVVRAAVIALLAAGTVTVQARAQQAQSNSSVPTLSNVAEGPRVREMARAEARFKDSAAPRYYKDHTTTVTISTVVLVIALVVLVLVLI